MLLRERKEKRHDVKSAEVDDTESGEDDVLGYLGNEDPAPGEAGEGGEGVELHLCSLEVEISLAKQ